jgi:hypothetical protein
LPAGSHRLSKAILNRVCAFARQERGLRVFPYTKGIDFLLHLLAS